MERAINAKLFEEQAGLIIEEIKKPTIVYMYFSKDNYKFPSICNSDSENYRKLSEELIAKCINKCTWIKSVKRVQMFTYVKIIVTYDHGGKSEYSLYGSNV